MEESLIISTNKELASSDGIAIVDLMTGTNSCNGFKNNICGSGGSLALLINLYNLLM